MLTEALHRINTTMVLRTQLSFIRNTIENCYFPVEGHFSQWKVRDFLNRSTQTPFQKDVYAVVYGQLWDELYEKNKQLPWYLSYLPSETDLYQRLIEKMQAHRWLIHPIY